MAQQTPWMSIDYMVNTFEDWPHQYPSSITMAMAGFCHNPSSLQQDRSVCYHCKLQLDDWKGQNPFDDHLKFSPDCLIAQSLQKPETYRQNREREQEIKDQQEQQIEEQRLEYQQRLARQNQEKQNRQRDEDAKHWADFASKHKVIESTPIETTVKLSPPAPQASFSAPITPAVSSSNMIPPFIPPTPSAVFQCRRCPEKLPSNTQLHNHVRKHHTKTAKPDVPAPSPVKPSSSIIQEDDLALWLGRKILRMGDSGITVPISFTSPGRTPVAIHAFATPLAIETTSYGEVRTELDTKSHTPLPGRIRTNSFNLATQKPTSSRGDFVTDLHAKVGESPIHNVSTEPNTPIATSHGDFSTDPHTQS
ncbi:hypothetical protein MMC12_008304, partial [Toensbergia leucococca]|nr:hypothetical protein [Toensbergia leucococca]